MKKEENSKHEYLREIFEQNTCSCLSARKVTFFTHTHLQTSLCIFSITFIENPLKQTHECVMLLCAINQLPIMMMMLASICMSHKSVFPCVWGFFKTQVLHYKKFIMTFELYEEKRSTYVTTLICMI